MRLSVILPTHNVMRELQRAPRGSILRRALVERDDWLDANG
jgi:hypothetical protein